MPRELPGVVTIKRSPRLISLSFASPTVLEASIQTSTASFRLKDSNPGVGPFSRELAGEGEGLADPLLVELRDGEDLIFVVRVPGIADCLTMDGFEHPRLVGADSRLERWETVMLNPASGEERRIPGRPRSAVWSGPGQPDLSGDLEVEFDWEIPEDWSHIRMSEIRGTSESVPFTDSRGRASKTPALDVILVVDHDTLSRAEIVRVVGDRSKRLGSRSLQEGTVPDGTWVSELFGLSPQDLVEADRLEWKLIEVLSNISIDLTRRYRLYDWVAGAYPAVAWALEWGLPSPLDIDAIMGAFIPLESRSADSFNPDEQPLHLGFSNLVSVGSPMFSTIVTSIAIQAYGTDRYLLPDTPDRPERIKEVIDPGFWEFSRVIPVTSCSVPRATETIGLRLIVAGAYRKRYLGLEIPGTIGSFRVLITNTRNRFSLDDPGNGVLPYPKDPYSWMNMPAFTAIDEARFPREILPAVLPAQIIGHTIKTEGIRKGADDGMVVYRAEWFVPTAISDRGQPP